MPDTNRKTEPTDPRRAPKHERLADRPFVVPDTAKDTRVSDEIMAARVRAMVERATQPSSFAREREALAAMTLRAFEPRIQEVKAIERSVLDQAGPVLNPSQTSDTED